MIKWIFIALLFFFDLPQLSAQSALEVTVNNIASAKGKVMLALFKQDNGFPGNPKNAYLLHNCRAAKGSIKLVFENIPAGTYALAIFHDADSNGKLDTNVLGIPKEDYGFSNNARPAFRAPTFKEAAFSFEKTSTLTITIK